MANYRAEGAAKLGSLRSSSGSHAKRNARSTSALKVGMLGTLATATIAVPIVTATANVGEETVIALPTVSVETEVPTVQDASSALTTQLPTAPATAAPAANQYVNANGVTSLEAVPAKTVIATDGSEIEIAASGEYQMPAPGATLTSPFGYRIHPVQGYSKMHNGVDWAAACGSPIFAAEAGEVIEVGYNGTSGNLVKVQHADGLITEYFHLSSSNVSVGQVVEKGQNIASMGNTGLSSGCHLHFGVMRGEGNYIDPMSLWG